MKRLLMLGVALLLQSCASHYEAPTEGPTARLRVQMDAGDYVVQLSTWPKGMCVLQPTRLGAIGSPRQILTSYAEAQRSTLDMLGGTSEANPRRIERVVPANQRFSVNLIAGLSGGVSISSVGAVFSGTSCNQAVAFTPKAGSQYEVTHSYDGKLCRVDVSELIPSATGFSRIPVGDATGHVCSRGEDLAAKSGNAKVQSVPVSAQP